MTACLPALTRVLAGIMIAGFLVLPARGERVRTISASGQFFAYANSTVTSAELCALGESTKRQWLLALGLTDKWRDPIVLVAVTNKTPLRVQIFQTAIHLKYQIDCGAGVAADAVELKASIVQALCAEYANRNQNIERGAGYVSAPVPLWLSRGLLLNMDGRAELLFPVIRRSVSEDCPVGTAELLATDALPAEDAPRQAYLAHAWLWTEGLMNLPGGEKKLQQFLRELGAQKSTAKAFASVYGADFPTDVMREKWWCLTLAQSAASIVAENYSAVDTSRRLTEITAGEVSRELLPAKLHALEALDILAHPSYRKVIAAYAKAFAELRGSRLNRQRYLLDQARQLHARADDESKAISDYLDKFDK